MTSRTMMHTVLACTLLFFGFNVSVAADRIPARSDFGTTQLAAIQARYDAVPDDCGGPDEPAFLCSTVLFRFTGDGVGYHVWNPSPTSVSMGVVSFAYLRADVNFGGTPWNDRDGLIFSPAKALDAATIHPIMLCAFPLEANTWNRSQKGCGAYANGAYPTGRPCQEQGIQTVAQWMQHVTQAGAPIYAKQCGFTIDGSADPASAFLAVLQARALLPVAEFNIWNEVLLATWPQNVGASLPIEAFFYVVISGQSGLAGAQRNQRDLLNTSGVAVPVIKITLPTTLGGKSSFAYTPADQAIALPTLPASLDQSPSVVQAPTGTLSAQDILTRKDIEVSVPAQSGLPAGSTGRVRWVGTRAYYETPARPLAADTPTVFSIPRGSVLATLGQSVDVSFVATDKTLAEERTSRVLTIAVGAADGTLPPAELAADRSYARIDYPGMLSTDQIWVSYEGRSVNDTPYPRKTAAFNAGLLPSWLGAPDQVYYWVKRGTQLLVSPVLSPTHAPWPIVRDAANGWLDFAALTSDPAVTVAPWDGIATGQSVWLDALAYFPDGTEQRARLIDGAIVDDAMVEQGLHATVSRDWLRRLPDGSAVFLRALAGSDLAQARAFPVTRLTLRNAPGPIVTKPLPQVVDAQADGAALPVDGLLSRSAFTGTAQVRVAPWPGMALGQRVWLRVHGRKPDGSEAVIGLASNEATVAADLTNGLIRPVPLAQLDALADRSPLTVELKVGFEKLADETRALRFPVNHMAFGK
ncbi:hypothetical protein HBF26_18565 [Luteibacter jiangsuensis]|uniref:Uncharacterized protein n=1 Tax=Luteibacter jiangsuensis TaxID=637577 RepID=A0ABX0QBX2_9GAMM|nr:hypothetical protein [Luteibacter jiangsuensis]NID06897.1 hypothetical protein [Luteibacter jiangsuensis]